MRHAESERLATESGRRCWTHYRLAGAFGALLALTVGSAAAQPTFIPNSVITSTVPANGDLNPYGVAFVPPNFPAGGTIAPFDILVSNFNNKKNLQGTGTTIIQYTPNSSKAIAPPGNATVFFQSKAGGVTGLDTGLFVLQKGFVLVCFLPSTDGTFATAKPGGILVLDGSGKVLNSNLASGTTKINAPWDMTVFDKGTSALAFVSNVGKANNHGFVTRLNFSISSSTVSLVSATIVASGYMAQPNAVGFVTGPTGLVYDPATDILYVASTLDNAVFAVPRAGTRGSSAGPGTMIFNSAKVLRGPLGMAQAPNGDLILANSDLTANADIAHPSEYLEITKNGTRPSSFVSQFNIDVAQGGAFGIAVGETAQSAPILAVVDDNVPDLSVLTGLPPAINGAEQ